MDSKTKTEDDLPINSGEELIITKHAPDPNGSLTHVHVLR